MGDIIMPILLGIFISVLGILNMEGNVSLIHWYHCQRVSEENRLPFAKRVGLGTLMIGVCVIGFGLLLLAAELTKMDFFTKIGAALVLLGAAAGLAISLHAMIKYNKGIF